MDNATHLGLDVHKEPSPSRGPRLRVGGPVSTPLPVPLDRCRQDRNVAVVTVARELSGFIWV